MNKWSWKWKIKRFFKWLYLIIPVTMGKHIGVIIEYQKKIKEIKATHKIEHEETEKRIDEIIKTFSNTTIYNKKNSPHYVISFEFSQILINNMTEIHKKEIMARRIGYIVREEILRSNFIQLPEV
jgi:hypothetical protein